MMRLTFRSFTWNWGPLPAMVPGVLSWVVWLASDSIPAALPVWLIGACYLLYAWHVERRYPNRSDLPEWQEYEAAWQARLAGRRNKDSL